MKALCRDLGTMEYETCWKLQQELFDALLASKRSGAENRVGGDGNGTPTEAKAGNEAGAGAGAGTEAGAEAEAGAGAKTDRESGTATGNLPGDVGTVLLVEHPPVYTLGKSGHAENLLVSREALEAAGARFFHIDRGGDITFHGPGQLVCYPILDLERIGIGLRDYIDALEEAVIRTVAQYGIAAGRIPGASGVWIEPESRRPRKICAIGVRSSRYVTMHGFALNVTTDLGWFSRINPCGFTDRGVASILSETGRKVPMEEVKKLVVKFLSEKLNVEIYK